MKLFKPRTFFQCFACFCFFSLVVIKQKNRQRQNKDGTKMERDKIGVAKFHLIVQCKFMET